MRMVAVKCFKCGGEGHKYRKCPLWERKVKRVVLMGIKRFDHETKVKVRSERQNLQAASQLCTKQVGTGEINQIIESLLVTNFIRPYLHQFFDDSHGLKASLKPLRRPFDRYQSRLEAINIGRDIRQINW